MKSRIKWEGVRVGVKRVMEDKGEMEEEETGQREQKGQIQSVCTQGRLQVPSFR
jgi:hypothetical protein